MLSIALRLKLFWIYYQTFKMLEISCVQFGVDTNLGQIYCSKAFESARMQT